MARTEPIVMARFRTEGYTLEGYTATLGYEGLRRAIEIGPEAIQAEVEASGLTGRSGGAGFPAARKWSLLAPGKPSYVVVNGDESEPGFGKDRVLMEEDPHQLIEGSLICAFATGSAQVFLYVRGEMAMAQERLAQALTDAYAAGYAGKNIMGTGVDIDVVLHWGAGAYIVGEETALIESLEGQRGMPRLKPPFFPAVKGVYMQPTIVNNVETLSNLPWIILNGGAAFAELGTNRSLGMRMFTLSGHVNRPDNYEIELASIDFRELFEGLSFGGGMRDGNKLKAFLVGASFPWLFEEHLDVKLDIDEVQKAGSMLGSGIVVMDDTTCAVRAAHNLVRFFAHESCGKCTPCREGTSWLEKILRRIETGQGREDDLELLLDVSDNISPGIAWPPKQTTICPLGPSAVAPIASSIQRFRDEYLLHIKEGGCPRGRH
jgi:NADH-quinone oxidoreductase subunit F